MSDTAAPAELSRMKQFGILVFVLLCGCPALELNGFGFGLNLSLQTAVACAAVGGVLGGCLICPRPVLAGLAGGLLAGPLGLIAIYYYTQHRQSVWHLELVLVQAIGCLPGLAVGKFLKNLLSGGARDGAA